jgi:uncharacterized protein YybS (DUF2232 family)
MYTTLIFFGIVIFPIASLVQCIRRGLNPYYGVLNASVAVGVGSLLIFIFANMSGTSVAAELEASYEAYMPMLLQAFPDQEALLRQTIDVIISGFPSTILLMGAVASYLEYLILSKFVRNGEKGAWQMARLREFAWPRSGIYGWLLVFILSWLTGLTGIQGGDLVMLNVQNIFEAAFALQGTSLLLMFFFMKKTPRGIGPALAVLAWILPLGKSVLFLLGIADIMFGLRTRISQR